MAKEDSLVFEVSAIDSASRIFNQVGASVKALEKSYASLRSAFEAIGIGLSGAAFIAMTKSAADAADAAAKMGDRFGIATEQMIGMQHAANLAGVSNEGLTTALRGLAKSGVEAAQGNEAARTAFERLHIQASEFLKLPMDQQLSLVIDRLGGMENAAVRNATAQALMGRNAGEMMGLVAEGSEAFKTAAADTLAWGLAIDRVDAAKIEMANEAIKRAEAATKGLFTQISIHLSPTIIELANQFADAAKETRGFKDQVSFLDDGLKAAASLALAAQDIFFGLGHQIGAVGAAIAALLRGEFASAYNIIEEANADVLQHTVETNAAIDRVWKATGTSIDEEAKRIAKRRQAMMKEGGDPGIVQFDSYTAALAAQLGALIEHNRNELAVVQAHYDQKQALLDESVAKGLITDDYWQGQSMLIFQQYQDAKARAIFQEFLLHEQKNQAVVNMERNTWQLGAEFLQTFAGKSRAAAIAVIAINKALAIAQTISATAVAVMRAFSDLGPIAGPVAAAEIKTLGAIQIGLIAATGLGQALNLPRGGASLGSSANPVITAPSVPSGSGLQQGSPGGQTVVNINIEGNVTQDILDQLKDLFGNDGVLIPANSRQASVITQGI